MGAQKGRSVKGDIGKPFVAEGLFITSDCPIYVVGLVVKDARHDVILSRALLRATFIDKY